MALSLTQARPTTVGPEIGKRVTAMRVLLATDASNGARTATDWLTALLLPAATEIGIVAVAEVPRAVPPEAPLPRSDEAMAEAACRAAEETLAVVARRWPRAEVRVLHGDARALIPEYAREWHADLVVVGARGLGAVAGFFLGSVSTAVVRDAPCSVLVVKGGPRGLDTAMIAVDGSEDSLAATRFFAALPLERRPAVRLVGAIEPPYVPRSAPAVVLGAIQRAIDSILAERRRRIDDGLAAAETELRDTAARIERTTPVGAPAEAILAAAKDAAVDLLVVGARGLGTVERLVLGSVSERVLHHAECPVLVVKRPS